MTWFQKNNIDGMLGSARLAVISMKTIKLDHATVHSVINALKYDSAKVCEVAKYVLKAWVRI